MALLAPSLLSADFVRLAEEIARVEAAGADWLHLDIMDGHFVPNLTFGPPVVAAIRKISKLPLDVHLMVSNPAALVEQFAEAGANYLTVHVETEPHLHRLVNRIRELGVKPAVTLNPATSVDLLDEILSEVDMVLVMSVNPGFGGQKFIENTYKKIAETKDLIISNNSTALIQVDGGVNLDNAGKLFESGADVLVAGNAVFSSENPERTIELLKI